MDQDAIGMEVGLGPDDIVLDGLGPPSGSEPLPSNFLPNVCCGQTDVRMPLSMEVVGLGPGDIVLHGIQLPQKGIYLHFWPMSIVAKRLDGS